MSFEWKGVFPALLTPFTKNDELDMVMFEKNLAAQLDAGIHGIIIGGSLGEASTITEKEKEELVEFSVEYINGKIPVILNIAESTTQEAIKQTESARKWGADGIMLLPPMRYKTDDRETICYFKTVARTTELPVMIYNNPVDYKIDARPELFEQLVECENITALKESSRDVTNLTRMKNLYGDRFKVLCGVDTLAMEELCLGADGWVAGLVCAFPKETVAIYNLVKAGKIADAIKIYRWFMPLLELDIHPKLVQYIKLAAAQTGIGSEYVRAPRLTLADDEREKILKIINEGIKSKPSL
ncbi:MAG TPA: dihydrodipicolinate synthase family protein [Chitinophagaceae bacterium]|mgnify:CR=1 FL=1|nr:dihydrodipicolinate synthase family protein [Chitinophagaceae bacterium]